ncbi:acyl-CoA reductase [Nonlabens spongiae]|uniref:acyl-CoA reductase n=1 Tax=Nonlabens spongiae TaxID=331648 RepID=UPI0012F4A59A|nr:acyl-CoA reductase [Nonlabens spongiae]
MGKISINSTLNGRISAFAKAGSLLTSYLNGKLGESQEAHWEERIDTALQTAEAKNPWFTQENLEYCLQQWSEALQQEKLKAWLTPYHLQNISPKTIAIVAAGNIPLVGLHDVMTVILTGHRALIKVSGNDDVLLPLILDIATHFLPELADSYVFTKEKLEDYDAVIATGSDNTARYFEYYFGNKPHIIRKNRNSIAVLTGEESIEDMIALSEDVFRYFGLGCRSVSHLKVPRGYNFDRFFNGMYSKRDLINNRKYLNNYDYNKAVYLMSEFDCLDNEFLIIKQEENSYTSPIASLGYSYYDDLGEIASEISSNQEELQCVVSSAETRDKIGLESLKAPQFVDFGMTQQPQLSDYADGVDTVDFLIGLS